MKETVVTLEDGGQEKNFKIRQMPATKAERFIYKFVLLLGGNAELDKMGDDMGALFSAISHQPYEKVQELLDALISCVSIHYNDTNIEKQLTPENIDSYIEDMSTLMKLRAEAFKANNFFQQSGLPGLEKSPAPAITIKRAK
jgi:hypothetical protein